MSFIQINAREDAFYMRRALDEAHAAYEEGEVPVGAVVVCKGRIIGRGHNQIEAAKDATAHAEILAIGAAGQSLKDWRLDQCSLYVTLEPCPMCAGAILNSRLHRVVYGCPDKRFGACGSVFNLFQNNVLQKDVALTHGVLAEDCLSLIQGFFKALRRSGKKHPSP